MSTINFGNDVQPLAIAARRSCIAIAGTAVLITGVSLSAQSSNQVTIHAPEAQTYDVALNELELSLPPRTALGGEPVLIPVSGARVVRQRSDAATFEVSADSPSTLVALARTLEDANPGTRANVVLYLAGERRSTVTRRILTHEVAVILREGVDETAFQLQHLQYAAGTFPGIPRAYILNATDSFGALELANELRAQADVQHAYPLIRQQLFAR